MSLGSDVLGSMARVWDQGGLGVCVQREGAADWFAVEEACFSISVPWQLFSSEVAS